MLFFKLEDKYWSNLKTFLVFLNRMPLEEVSTQGLKLNKGVHTPLNNELIKIIEVDIKLLIIFNDESQLKPTVMIITQE